MRGNIAFRALAQRISQESTLKELCHLCEDIFAKIFTKNSQQLVFEDKPELGLNEEFKLFEKQLKKNGMRIILKKTDVCLLVHEVIEIKLTRSA